MRHRRSSPLSARLAAAGRRLLPSLFRVLLGRRALSVLAVTVVVAGIALVVPLVMAGRGALSTSESAVMTTAEDAGQRTGVVTMGVDGEPAPGSAGAGSASSGPSSSSATSSSGSASSASASSPAGSRSGTAAAPGTASSSAPAGVPSSAASSAAEAPHSPADQPSSSPAGTPSASAGAPPAGSPSAAGSSSASAAAPAPQAAPAAPAVPAPGTTSPAPAPSPTPSRSSAPAPSPGPAALPAPGATAAAVPGGAAAVLAAVDVARVAAGCDPLTRDAGLAAQAEAHGEEMRRAGGEVPVGSGAVAAGTRDGGTVVAGWLAGSAAGDLLDCSLTSAGAAVVGGPGGPFWTLLLA